MVTRSHLVGLSMGTVKRRRGLPKFVCGGVSVLQFLGTRKSSSIRGPENWCANTSQLQNTCVVLTFFFASPAPAQDAARHRLPGGLPARPVVGCARGQQPVPVRLPGSPGCLPEMLFCKHNHAINNRKERSSSLTLRDCILVVF